MAEFSDMLLFVRAVSAGSLSAAGRQLGLSPAVASKRLTRLEADLGIRLIHRTSRRLTLTQEGGVYHEHCVAILAEIEEAEAAATGGRVEPHGELKVTAPVDFGRHWVGKYVTEFARAHPKITIHLNLTNALVDLLERGYDLAVRTGALEDSSLVSRRIAPNRRVLCAAPSYLKRNGIPKKPSDLIDHKCLVIQAVGRPASVWTFRGPNGAEAIRPLHYLSSNNGEMVHDWALDGQGLAFKSIWDVADDLASGRLVTVLNDYTSESSEIYAVFPSRRFLPAKTRLFIEFLSKELAQAARRIGLPETVPTKKK